tara:strand:- start:334 stop:975 length:642 start_codon:yes stop_codon:yes gene_type:complete
MKYTLLVSGTCFEGSAHILTENEVKILHEFKQKNGYGSWEEMHSDLSTILENYDPDNTNYWVTSTALKTPRLHFVLLNENQNVVWDSNPNELSDIEDENTWSEYPDAIARLNENDWLLPTKEIDAYPHDEKPNILLVYQEVKGTLMNFTIESDTQPNPKDFAHTTQSLETPEYEIELVDRVFYRGQLLEREYDHENWRGKNLIVEVFTMEDVE